MGAAYHCLIVLGKECKGVDDIYVVNTLFLLRYDIGNDTGDVVTMWYDRKEKKKKRRKEINSVVVRQWEEKKGRR